MLNKLNNIAKQSFIIGTSFVVASGVALSSAVCSVVGTTLTLPMNVVRGTKVLVRVANQHIIQATKE